MIDQLVGVGTRQPVAGGEGGPVGEQWRHTNHEREAGATPPHHLDGAPERAAELYLDDAVVIHVTREDTVAADPRRRVHGEVHAARQLYRRGGQGPPEGGWHLAPKAPREAGQGSRGEAGGLLFR